MSDERSPDVARRTRESPSDPDSPSTIEVRPGSQDSGHGDTDHPGAAGPDDPRTIGGDGSHGIPAGTPGSIHERDAGLLAVDMRTSLAGVELPNPVMTASGCAAAGRELDQFFPVDGLGAVVTKSIMLGPRSGRATPRMAETPSGMLNSIGLQGQGIDAFCASDLPWLRERGARAAVSIAGGSIEEYGKLAARLADEIGDSGSSDRTRGGIALVEVNISCPNVEDRGQVFACDPVAAAAVLDAVRRELPGHVPVFAKLSPDVTDIVAVGQACIEAGAHGLSAINTLLGMAIDVDTMRPTLAGVTGGLSGPAIRPVAVRCIWQLHAAMPDVPIIGVGGIKTGLDALELVLAGASAVQVGTVIFHDPHAPVRVLGELADALAARGLSRFADAIGRAHRSPSAPDEWQVGSTGSSQRAVDPRSVRNNGPFHRTGGTA